jgi:hypothetical protein
MSVPNSESSNIMSEMSLFAERRNAFAFWFGSAIVTVGVLLHIPMFWMARDMNFVLAGMPMDPGMLWGMALIVVGIGFAGYGLLPRFATGSRTYELIAPPEDGPLTLAPNPGNPSEWGVFDLQFDPKDYLEAGDDQLKAAIDGKVKAIRRVSINSQPGLLPLRFAPADIRGGLAETYRSGFID